MISDFCIKRPVFAAVLSLLIVVLGMASLLRLPIRELPDVDSAIVGVTTTYLGASPEIVDTDVTEVIESAVAGVAGVKSIISTSQRGRGRTVIEFEPGRNIDEAANDVRDAVARVRPDLPDDVDEPQVAKSDSDSDPMMRIAVTSDRMSAAEITDYVERFVLDRLSTLEGIAQVRIFGERRYAIRIWLDRRAMAARNLTVDDVEQALRRNNVELPAGELKSTTRQFTVRAQSRLSSVEQFENIMIERIDGYPIRLADIARIERGVEDDESIVRSHGREAVGLGVLRQSQANTIAISNRVREQLDLIRPNLPVGMEIAIGSDDAVFINESIREVVRALGIAVVLVVLVIFAFLASARATMVPAVAIPGGGDRRIHRHLRARLLDQRAHAARADSRDRHRGRRCDRRARERPAPHRARRIAAGRGRARHAPGDLRGDRDVADADRGIRADLVRARARSAGCSPSSASCSARRSRSRCWSRSPCVPPCAPSCSATVQDAAARRVWSSAGCAPRPAATDGCSSAAWTRPCWSCSSRC